MIARSLIARPFLLALALTACSAVTTPAPTLPPNPSLSPTPPRTAPSTLTTFPPTPHTPLPTALPTLAPTPLPSPTLTPALRQLTSGGCCVQPFWSPDGSQLWFIDHPSPDSPAGVWGVPLTGGDPQFISDRPGYYSRDGQYLTYPEKDVTYIQNVASGERWPLPVVNGRFISISPDSAHIAWQVNSSHFNLDGRTVDIWIANLDGSDPHQAVRLVGGGLSSWFPVSASDSARLLVTTRASAGADLQLNILNLSDGSLTPLQTIKGLRGLSLSPQGSWVAYTVTFSGDPAQDGLWALSTQPNSQPIHLNTFGSFRWRSDNQLLVVPLETIVGTPSHRLLQFDLPAGTITPLTDPALTPFRIANGDWTISPDGSTFVFLSEADHNLWALPLP
jgi:WD40-like Beta Propeller Repeat